MARVVNALEISSTAIKLVVGYECEQELIVIHASKKNLDENIIVDNVINDADVVCKTIKELITETEATLNTTINDVSLVLPSRGLDIFKNVGSTNVVSLNKTIAEIDIRNAMTMLLRFEYGDANNEIEVIDVIPITYKLDQERSFSNPPLNETSASLELTAFIHTMPRYIKETYEGLVERVGIKVSNILVGSYGISQLLTTYRNMPKKYILIDVGGKTTIATIISGGKPYKSIYFDKGGENLTQELMYRLGITYKNADELKCKYGMDNFVCEYAPIVCHSEQNPEVKFTIKDLRLIIEDFLVNYVKDINRALKTMVGDSAELEQWPLVFVGGGTALIGFKEFVESKFASRNVIFPTIKSLGARNPSFIAALGALKINSSVRINEVKEEQKPMSLTRDKHKTQKYSEVEDNL